MSTKVIRTIGKADLNEDIIFNSRGLLIGDTVVLKPTKPASASAYGVARVTGYEGYDGCGACPQSEPIKFKAKRIS